MTNLIIFCMLVINWMSTSLWLLIIPCLIAAAVIYHRIQLKKLWHKKREWERKALELEALLFHSRENEKKIKEEAGSVVDFHKQLLAKLNHEVRNPLNGVSGMSTLLGTTSLTDEQRGYLQSIRDCGTDVMTALNSLFTAAGVANGDESKFKNKVATQQKSNSPVPVKLSEEFASHYPLKILVAEDDPLNQQLAVMVLTRLGYTADIAPNGKEVLEIVSEKKYDMILMDIQMPEMDGLEATRMIRLCLSSQPVIIAMTANAMEGDKEACFTSGMDDYISKPVNIDELVELLQKWALHVKEER